MTNLEPLLPTPEIGLSSLMSSCLDPVSWERACALGSTQVWTPQPPPLWSGAVCGLPHSEGWEACRPRPTTLASMWYLSGSVQPGPKGYSGGPSPGLLTPPRVSAILLLLVIPHQVDPGALWGFIKLSQLSWSSGDVTCGRASLRQGEELRRRGALSPWGGAPGCSLEGSRQGGLSVGVCVGVVCACVRAICVCGVCMCICVCGGWRMHEPVRESCSR